jgi:hypothetical protein
MPVTLYEELLGGCVRDKIRYISVHLGRGPFGLTNLDDAISTLSALAVCLPFASCVLAHEAMNWVSCRSSSDLDLNKQGLPHCMSA